MTDRDKRIEHYYHWSAWDLAERIVDLEDELKGLRENAQFLTALYVSGVENWEGYGEAWARYDARASDD